jgi:serine/threonine protein kinase
MTDDEKANEPLGVLPVGTRLHNYELLSVLGHGSFGITYRARNARLGHEVAIKEYLPIDLALRKGGTSVVPRSPEFEEHFDWGRERFLEEARTLLRLDHVAAVVRVLDFIEAHGTAYMVMALVRGETLERRLKRDKRLPAPIVERMFGRLLDGLEQVHSAGVMHRDIKPANIILDASDNPTLIDFGAARASMAERTVTMTSVYTPRYAAVEQFTARRQGPWTDIYCLSATLYHAITGDAPPPSVERTIEDTYRPLRELAPAGFSQALLKAVDAGLAVRALDRPQSIASWRVELARHDDAASGETFAAPRPPASTAQRAEAGLPPPAPAEAAKPSAASTGIYAGKRVLRLGGAALALVLLGAGAYWGLALGPEAESPKPASPPQTLQAGKPNVETAMRGGPPAATTILTPAGPQAPAPADECDQLSMEEVNVRPRHPDFGEAFQHDGLAALAACERAAQRDPNEVRFVFLRGLALQRLGRYGEAVQLYRRAADRGDAFAQARLGLMYLDGIGVERNEAEAARLFRLAADRGHPVAQYYLASMYATGRGVEKNEAEAARLFRLISDMGYPAVQYQLGLMYFDGSGVEKNEAEAIRLYRLAARQGDSAAQAALRRLNQPW